MKTEYQKFFPDNFTLETPRVLLRLITPEDYESLLPLTKEKAIWTYFRNDLSDENVFKSWIQKLRKERDEEKRAPFILIDKHSNEICGSASFMAISFPDKRVEIGSVWLGSAFMGTGIIRPVFFALFSYAFEVMKMERVEVRVDNLNERAKAAYLKVGMIPEGVLRSVDIIHGNRRRDVLYLSILRQEWGERKQSFFSEMLY
ncbi:GNAT family N-acetyltransferase [Niastella sp. OAS944]|uniref:GNAT family N-acetyltransferase n=1 Tax=Niastella sp. OAS944 TaxID=2664089 RepID=UPI00347CB324|nr:RimJ/RimL family protein N-acetyltransferase [Chitinophagaceae bacterium OAS944]